MRNALPLCCVLLVLCGLAMPVQGDIVVFTVPTTKVKFVMQGKALESRSRVNFTHTVSKLTFDLPKGQETEVITLLPVNQIGTKKISKAKGDESQLREAATWCLDHGLLVEFNRALDQLTALNANDTFVAEIKRLKEELGKPVADMAEAEADLMKKYGGGTGKVVKSAHFALVTSGDKADKSEVKRKRPEVRVEQFEHFLQIFLFKCAQLGLTVHAPTATLKVAVVPVPTKVKTSDHLNPLDKNVMWSPSENTLFIDERSKIAGLDTVKKFQNDITKAQAQPKSRRNNNNQNQPGANAGPGANGSDPLAKATVGDLAKLATTLQSLMFIGVENFEWESASREGAYMLLANCGLTTRETPRWAQDGLAAYFEFPAEMGGVKLGDLGQIREAWYQASLADPDRITVTDIITGHLYEDTSSPNATIRATTQAWALMHYLVNKRPEGVAAYLASFQSMPPDVVVGEDVLAAIFDKSFDGDRPALEEAWRTHMTDLKPDWKAIQEEEGATTVPNEK